MAADLSRSDSHRNIVVEFKEVLKQCTLAGHCSRQFVRIQKLKEWFSTNANTQNLLYAAYTPIDCIYPPTSSNAIDNGADCALLVFSILLELGQGALIHFFNQNDMVDRKLPFRKRDLANLYESVAQDIQYSKIIKGKDAKTLMEEFSARQYAFCPITFQFEQTKIYQSDQVLPVTETQKTLINDKGGTASVWQISILEEFIDQRLRDAIVSSRYVNERDGLGPRYRLALKRFQGENGQFYHTEKEAFRALAYQDGMIQYLGAFSHSEGARQNYNILLEYGQLDLDEFFFDPEILPPVLSEEINSFWDEIFDVVNALKNLHNFRVKRDDVSREYYGWHADIKPDNILRVDGKFKLADPGFASFKKAEAANKLQERADRRAEQKEVATVLKQKEVATVYKGGTVTYGAPECHFGKGQERLVTRAIDVWSLGCVLSVVATWVVLGQQGILQFTRLRERAVDEVISRMNGQNHADHGDVLRKGDYFHNGHDVLPIVTDWHNHLRECKRASDNITHNILDMVDKAMLCGDPERRYSATKLHTELESLLTQSRAIPSNGLSQEFCNALRELDNEILSEPRKPEPVPIPDPVQGDHVLSAESRKIRKTMLLSTPLKRTTNRSEALRSSQRVTQRSDTFHNSQATVRGFASPYTQHDQAIPAPQVHVQVPTIVEPENRPVHGSADSNPRYQGSRHSSSTLVSPPRSSVIVTQESISLPNMSHLPRTKTGESSVSALTRSITAPGKLPRLNAFQARAQLERRKSGKAGIAAKGAEFFGKLPKKDDILTQYFSNRDLHFLIDNADTMVEFWDEAIFLLSVLVEKAVGQDENGMDLSFTHSKYRVDGSNKVKDFVQKMELARPKVNGGAHTDMEQRLGDILDGYIRYLKTPATRRNPAGPRKLTLVVFTDGLWEGMEDKNAIGKLVAEFAKDMLHVEGNNLKKRTVSFQFVQFGNDEEVRLRLWKLDDALPREENIPDMIDTIDSTGNVFKMLLGSFVPIFDFDD